jgi:hypothetical protein
MTPDAGESPVLRQAGHICIGRVGGGAYLCILRPADQRVEAAA